MTTELKDVTYIKWEGNYAGATPNVADAQKWDTAKDLSTGETWTCIYPAADPQVWLRKGADCAVYLDVDAGASVAARVDTSDNLPSFVTLYAGDDTDVPSALRTAATALVIEHNLGINMPGISVTYYDTVAGIWVNVVLTTGDYKQSEDLNWVSIAGFQTKTGGNKTYIRLAGGLV